jgi:hypothetical protein
MLKLVNPVKRWATGAWTKQKQVPVILRVELHPTPEAMLTSLCQSTRHPRPYTSNWPMSLEDSIYPAPPYFTSGLEQVFAESWMRCSDGVVLSGALPRQSQARHSEVITKVTYPLLGSHPSVLYFSLPVLRRHLPLPFSVVLPRVGEVTIHAVQL